MPQNPIIFCHGLLGFDKLFGAINYWNRIPEALEAMGAECFVARVDATSAVETRAAQLVQQIAMRYRGRSVHLIGHSMGGLDCRHLVSHLLDGAGFNILSVTTIATPHRGSPVADTVLATRITDLPCFPFLLNLFPSGDGDGQAWRSLSTKTAKTFNACTRDRPGVRYFSYGASFHPGIIDALAWGASYTHILVTEGSNDGMVSVNSAKWGEYLGTVPDVNHTEIIGHKFVHTRPTDILNMLGGQAPFNPAQFFLKHATILAREVENCRK